MNSDDPPLFSTTLNHEVGLLFNAFTFDINTANDILLNGVRHSFLPQEEKQTMEAAFQQEMAQLQHELALFHIEAEKRRREQARLSVTCPLS